MSQRSQRGDSKFGCAIWILLLVVAAVIGFKTIPVKIASAELEDFIAERAQFAGQQSMAQLRAEILGKAAELRLPLKEKDVSIEKVTPDRVRIQATYTVELKFPFYQHDWVIVHDVTKDTYSF
jgi:hypothetical protein